MTNEEIVKQYEDTRKNLGDIQNKLRDYTTKVENDLQNTNNLSNEASKKVDELMLSMTPLQSQIREIEQAMAERSQQSQASNAKMSLVDFARNNEDFKSQVSNMVGRGYNGTAKLDINNAVTSIGDKDANLVGTQRVAGIISPAQQKLTIRDLLQWGQTASNAIEFARETGFTNSADFVKENPSVSKPKSEITFELDTAKVQTLAHWIPASKQVLDDINILTSYLGNRLMYGLKQKEEQALLFGDGTGVTIEGISTQASEFSNTVFGELLDTNSTEIDKLRVALLQAEVSGYSADALVLNLVDWAKIELTKDKNNNYLFGNPHGITTPAIWGRPVVSTNSITKGDFLVGAFGLGAMGWDRELASVMVSTEDRDNFVKNMVTILVEERLGLTVFRPDAFVKGKLNA